IFKHAILNNEEEANKLMATYPSIKELTHLEDIEAFLKMGIQTKLDIVIQDEFEGNVRKHLNRSEERRVGKECRNRRVTRNSSRRRHTRSKRDWSSDVCSSDLNI